MSFRQRSRLVGDRRLDLQNRMKGTRLGSFVEKYERIAPCYVCLLKR